MACIKNFAMLAVAGFTPSQLTLLGESVMRYKNEFSIHASRECIDNSERNSLHWCIFALAIIYSVPGSVHVRVDKDETRFSYKGYRYVFPTPGKSARIASAYDKGLLTKKEIAPWSDHLINPISVDKIQHRRPSHAAIRITKSKKARCTVHRSTRWGGRKI